MYFLYLNNAKFGPYTDEQVRGMIATGKVQPTTMVFEQGGAQHWQPVSNFPSLMRPPGKQAKAMAADPAIASIPLASGDLERTIWEGTPANWTILGRYIRYFFGIAGVTVVYLLVRSSVSSAFQIQLACMAGGFCVLLLLAAGWDWLVLKSRKWELTTERFTYSVGVLSRRTENMELYRIKDLTLRKPFLLRLLGYGFVDLVSSDRTDPTLVRIGAIRRPGDLYQMIRKYTERQRQRRGVREIDIS
jgi:hypothetical protein